VKKKGYENVQKQLENDKVYTEFQFCIHCNVYTTKRVIVHKIQLTKAGI